MPRRTTVPTGVRLGDATDAGEVVATALETVALRIRVGEFRVQGIVDDMTDVAVLAATLATLLAPHA